MDCVVSDWASWGPCTKRCAGGSSTRSREITTATAHGGVACPELEQTSSCNEDVSCDKWDLPTCQGDHVHCEIHRHKVNERKPVWREVLAKSTGGNGQGHFVFRNMKTGQEVNHIPDGVVVCGGGEHTGTAWHASDTLDRTTDPLWNGKGFVGERVGGFKARDNCLKTQSCGLADVGTCHDCDTEQECKDLGVSSTLFVTHHRKHMDKQVYNRSSGTYGQIQYHCRKKGISDCECMCNGHPPCAAHKGKMLENEALHANVYPNTPTMQDCCNMCTNHPKCGSWEYTSMKICVLKAGKPIFVSQPSGASFAAWAGCPAGETC